MIFNVYQNYHLEFQLNVLIKDNLQIPYHSEKLKITL